MHVFVIIRGLYGLKGSIIRELHEAWRCDAQKPARCYFVVRLAHPRHHDILNMLCVTVNLRYTFSLFLYEEIKGVMIGQECSSNREDKICL
jgi:hypothetical protein